MNLPNMATDTADEDHVDSLWQLLNRKLQEELDIARPAPAADDLAAHLKRCRTEPDDYYQQAESEMHKRTLVLVERLQTATQGSNAEFGRMVKHLWDAVLLLTQADVGNPNRTQAMADLLQLEGMTIRAGLRPWTPVLKPLLRHWYCHGGATLTTPNRHPNPLLPHAATVSHLPEVVLAGRALPVRPNQAMLPGFDDVGSPIRQSVLVEVLELGTGGRGLQGGRGAPLAARAWISCMLAAPRASWDYPARVTMTVREFLTRLYLPDTWPTGTLLTNRLERLQDEVFRVRMIAPDGRIRPVAIDWIPIDNRTGWTQYDEKMEFRVRLPQGLTKSGVPVDFAALRLVGMRSGPGYRALLNLFYTWHEHNRTLKPTGTRHWLQSHDPKDYAWFSDKQQIALAFPHQVITGRTHGHLLERSQKTWMTLAEHRAVRLVKEKGSHRVKLLPPKHFRKPSPEPLEPG